MSGSTITGALTLLVLFLSIGCTAFLWPTIYTPTPVFLTLMILYTVGGLAYIIEISSSANVEIATVIAWVLMLVLIGIYFSTRILFYTIMCILFTICVTPETGELSFASYQYSLQNQSGFEVALSICIPIIIGFVLVFVVSRMVGITAVRELLVALISAQSVVLLGYLCRREFRTSDIKSPSISADRVIEWLWLTCVALLAITKLVYTRIVSRRPNWCRFCKRVSGQLEMQKDHDEEEEEGY